MYTFDKIVLLSAVVLLKGEPVRPDDADSTHELIRLATSVSEKSPVVRITFMTTYGTPCGTLISGRRDSASVKDDV